MERPGNGLPRQRRRYVVRPRTLRRSTSARYLCILCYLCCCWLVGGRVNAAGTFDEARLAAFSAEGLLRWDVIEGRPSYVAGVAPRRLRENETPKLVLGPGQLSILHLGDGVMARVRSANPSALAQLRVWQSDGNGLFRAVATSRVLGDGSRIFIPQGLRSCLLLLECPSDSRCSITIDVSLSRREMPPSAFDYRCELGGCGKPCVVAVDGCEEDPWFYKLPALRQFPLGVRGRCRLRIRACMIYDDQEEAIRQSFQLRLRTDDGRVRFLEQLTSRETRYRITVDGTTVRTSRFATAYWDVPGDAQQVWLSSSVPVLVHVTAAPCKSAARVREQFPDSIWQIQTHDQLGELFATNYPVSRRWQLAVRSARDNRYRNGGIDAWNAMRQLAWQTPGHPRVLDAARNVAFHHTRYHPLVAETTSGDAQYGAFSIRGLRDPGEPPARRVLFHNDATRPHEYLSRGRFESVAPLASRSYRLDDHRSDTQLRVIVDRDSVSDGDQLFLQLDGATPLLLQFRDLDTLCLPRESTLAEAMLARRMALRIGPDGGTLDGHHADSGTPAPLLDVATAVFDVPATVQRVRLINGSRHTIRAAVQIRKTRPFMLTETEFLSALEEYQSAGSKLDATSLQAAATTTNDPTIEYARQQLRNFFFPLQDLIEQQAVRFTADIEPYASVVGVPSEQTNARQSVIAREARALMAREQWTEALRQWSRLVSSTSGALRVEAVMARIEALARLNDDYLMITELKGRCLHDHQPAVREACFQRLVRILEETEDISGQIELAAAMIMREPRPSHYLVLSRGLASRGKWEQALRAALLAGNVSDAEPLVRAAFHEGWWRVFEVGVSALESQRREDWLTYAQLKRNPAWPSSQPTSTDTTTDHIESHAIQGQQIAADLVHSEPVARLDAVRRWEMWYANHPSPHTWIIDHSLITNYSRAVRIRRRPGAASSMQFLATPDEPTTVRVQGPAELKLSCRPLHDPGRGIPLNDWIIVDGAGRRFVWPIADNDPDPHVRLLDNATSIAGQSVAMVISIGAGSFELAVSAEQHDMLVIASLSRPSEHIPTLPPLAPSTMTAILSGSWGATHALDVPVPSTRPKELGQRVGSANQLGDLNIVDHPHRPPTRYPLLGQHRGLAVSADISSSYFEDGVGETACAYAVRTSQPDPVATAAVMHRQLTAKPFVGTYAQLDLAARLNMAIDVPPSAAGTENGALWSSMLLARGRLQDAATLPLDRPSRQQVAIMLRAAERASTTAERERHALRVLAAAQSTPTDPWIQRSSRRVSVGGYWETTNEIESSAGLKRVEYRGPRPASDRYLTRLAMADNAALDTTPDFFLSGYRQLSIDVDETGPLELFLDMRQVYATFAQGTPATLELQVDDQDAQLIPLMTRDAKVTRHLRLQAGPHVIRLRLLDPRLGQLIAVAVSERTANGELQRWDHPETRLYHVATADRPVRYHGTGSDWLRIERRVGDESETTQLIHVAGKRTFVVEPPAGASQALVRISRFVFADRDVPPSTLVDLPAEPPVTRWLADDLLSPIGEMSVLDNTQLAEFSTNVLRPEETLLTNPSYGMSNVALADTFGVGDASDSTWSFGFGGAHRRALEEGFNGGGHDQFLQGKLSRQRFHDERSRYTLLDAILRARESSGPTFGVVYRQWQPLREWLTPWIIDSHCVPAQRRCWWDKLQHQFVAYGYVQRPGDPVPPQIKETEASLGFRSRVYYQQALSARVRHTPSFTLLGRALTMERNRYGADRVDQDVFTPFKEDHRFAVYLSDTIQYDISDTRRLLVRPALYSNEDLNIFQPDSFGVQAGVSSLWGTLHVDVSYRFTHYRSDRDRVDAAVQHLLLVDAMIDSWHHAGSRYQLDVSYRQEIEHGTAGGFITLSRFWSRGRGYRDSHASRIGFRRLRERAAYSIWHRAEMY